MKTAELIQELEKHIQTLNLKSDRVSIRLIRRSIMKLSEYASQQPTLSKESVIEVYVECSKQEAIRTLEYMYNSLTYKWFKKVNLTPAVSEQPDMSDKEIKIAATNFSHEQNWRGSSRKYDSFSFKKGAKWLQKRFQSIKSAKGEEYGNMSKAQIRRSKAREHLGGWFFVRSPDYKLLHEALDIAAGLPPPPR